MQDENKSVPDSDQVAYEVISSTPKKTMFNLSILLNVILFIGLVVLYILFFTSRQKETPVPRAFMSATGKHMSVVFVNIDSLNAKYDFVKSLKTDLEALGKRYQSEILSEQTEFEKEAADFQKRVSANTIPEAKAKIEYDALMQKQQALVEKKDRYTQEVADKEMNLNLKLLDTVTNFLKRYNRRFHYDYILGFKTAGEILVANDTLDITKDVLNILNKEYSDKIK